MGEVWLGLPVARAAAPHQADWTWAHWVLAVAALAGGFWVLTATRRKLSEEAGRSNTNPGHAPRIEQVRPSGRFGWGVAYVVSFVGVALLPGVMMRHMPAQRVAALTALIAVVAAGGVVASAMLMSASRHVEPATLVAAAVLAAGAVGGFAFDALTRLAASVPTSVPSVLLVGVLVVALFALAARRRT